MNITKIIIINLFLSILFLSANAQNKKFEKRLQGTWTLDSIELKNIDTLAKNIMDLQVGMVDMQISQLKETISATEDEDEIKTMQAQLNELLVQKSEFTIEKYKKEFNDQFQQLIGKFQIQFNKDKSFLVMPDEYEGTWSLNKKATELILIENNEERKITINELTKKTLVLKFEDGEAEMKIIMIMYFIKEKEL